MPDIAQNVAVLGAGLGGLAAAIAFAQRGARVVVFEQAHALREVGAGLQISPNGMCVLKALGLADVVRAQGTQAGAVVLHNFKGRAVTRLDLAHADGAYRFLHRADLIVILADRARQLGVEIALDHCVAAIEDGASPRVAFVSGNTEAADLIVAADGLHSVVRPILNGGAAPFFTGQVAWRALVPNSVDHPPEAWVHMGPGRHVVSYPLRDGQTVNLVAVEERRAWAAEGWHHKDAPSHMRAAFAGLKGPVSSLMAQVEDPNLWGLFRHPVARHWHGTSVALVGDAAHPTLPFLAQGANLAFEDAWVLAASVAKHGLSRGLPIYQATRAARAARVIEVANGNAWKYHLRNPVLRGGAHLGLSLLGRAAPKLLVRQFDWLYGHDVTTAPLP